MNRTGTNVLAALLIVGAAAFLSAFGPDDGSRGDRIFGAILGIVVAWYANVAPKSLKPFARMHCDPVHEQRARRTTGVALTLGGLGFAAACLFAPSGVAPWMSVTLLGGALLVSVGSWMYARSSSG